MALQLGIIMPISGNNKQIRVFLRRKTRLLTQCLLLVFFHTVPYVTRESANTCMWILPDNEATGVVYVKKRIYILPSLLPQPFRVLLISLERILDSISHSD